MSLQEKYERLETLFFKYIKHVGDCEGINFIDYVNNHTRSDVVFTEEEKLQLEELETLSAALDY